MLALILPSCKRREEMSLVLAVQTMYCAWEGASYTHRARYCIFNDSVQGVHKKLGEDEWTATYHMLRTSPNDFAPRICVCHKGDPWVFLSTRSEVDREIPITPIGVDTVNHQR